MADFEFTITERDPPVDLEEYIDYRILPLVGQEKNRAAAGLSMPN